MTELLDHYREWLSASGASGRTIESRVSGAKRLLDIAGTDNPVDISPEHTIRLMANVPKRSSKSTYYHHAARFAEWCATRGMHVTFTEGVPKPKTRRGTPRPISAAELSAAMLVADTRAAMMLRLAAFAGLRVSEIGRMRGEDITVDTLYVVGKGDKPAEVPLHPSIASHADSFPSHGWWFPNRRGEPSDRNLVWRTMVRPLRKVGSEATPHQVRHFYGTSLLAGGNDLRTVQTLLRHSDLSSTQIYTQVSDDMRRRAIASLPDIA